MNHKLFLLAAALSGVIPLAAASRDIRPSNIILVLADDIGYGDVGCYGATGVKTPNIDRLAQEGRRFMDAHSVSAVCTPSRYALLTGEYPFRHGDKGIWGPLSNRSGLIIDPGKLTLPRLLKDSGYATACIGKWHLGFGTTPCDWNKLLRPGPVELGFDYYYGIPTVSSGPPYVYVENDRIVGWDAADPMVEGGQPPSPTPVFPEKGANTFGGALKAHRFYDDEKSGTVLTEKAVDWIKSNQRKPFFIYLSTPNIHHPFTPHPRFKGTSSLGPYGDYIHELDWMTGEIMRTLDDTGLTNDTLIIFTSDNGGMLNLGGQEAMRRGHRLNGNLLGFKFDAWEGGHRVPFIARWPGRIEAGSTSNQLICLVDLFATLAALTKTKLTAADAPDSFNVLPALVGTPAKPIRDHAVLAANSPKHLAMRQGRWVYIGAAGGGGFKGTKVGDRLLAACRT